MLITLLAVLCTSTLSLAITKGKTFQWQLQGPIDLTVDANVFDIDLHDANNSDITTLKNNRTIVVCYFSAGSWEQWRSDIGSGGNFAVGNNLRGWPEERWWDIRATTVRNVILGRLDKASSRGCDAVEPDNVDAYMNNNGLGITKADQIDFLKWLSGEAHKRRLSVGLKNSVDLLSTLEPYFDWALNEECLEYNECSGYSVFLNHNKAVFHVEYVPEEAQGPAKQTAVCTNSSRPAGFATIIKTWGLTAWRLTCP